MIKLAEKNPSSKIGNSQRNFGAVSRSVPQFRENQKGIKGGSLVWSAKIRTDRKILTKLIKKE